MEIIKSVSKNIQLSKDLSPGAQRASLHPELSQGVLKVNSYRSTCLSIEAGGKCLCCPVISNALGKCQFVADKSK